MRMFNADAWLDACEPPSFIVGNTTYRGKLLDQLECERFLTMFKRSENGELTEEESSALVRELITALFPDPAEPARRWWQRKVPTISVADVFFALPELAQLQALETFSRSLVGPLPTPRETTMKRKLSEVMDESREAAKMPTTATSALRLSFSWPPFWSNTQGSLPTETSGDPAPAPG